ncbi:MAG: hypothetical protein K9N49_07515 [Candidatus Marinimicrobia bacterium]|nr:hypothetical protein [Candidatus Neomarinimicrobiota bacterium]
MALAILIVAVGLLAVFGLFPSGLAAGNQVTFETRAGLLADDIFDGLRARALIMDWGTFSSSASVTVSAPNLWQGGAGMTMSLPNSTETLNFLSADSLNIPELTLRARLESATVGTRILRLKLSVWPGEHGATPEDKAMHFFTEIYRHAM